MLAREAVQRILKEPRFQDIRRLEHYGYHAYSQNDEDGIIAEIFRRIGTTDRRFVEIGAGDGYENNTVFLLLQGWSGLWVEADGTNARRITSRLAEPIKEGRLQYLQQFVTRESVNELLLNCQLTGEIDFLSIDIDGNDYYLLEALTALSPRVVAIEYNAMFRPPIIWVNAYDPRRSWDGGNAYGASLSALEQLGRRKGYALVGTGIVGVNAFFVRNNLVADHFAGPFTADNLFNEPAYELQDAFRSGHPASWARGGEPI
ncbi:MAG: hypothetical protein JO121_31555 [Deltaproteobacteria bacterium]|nr:hypothetical protein [Deltaproteobacteria bacterium]